MPYFKTKMNYKQKYARIKTSYKIIIFIFLAFTGFKAYQYFAYHNIKKIYQNVKIVVFTEDVSSGGEIRLKLSRLVKFLEKNELLSNTSISKGSDVKQWDIAIGSARLILSQFDGIHDRILAVQNNCLYKWNVHVKTDSPIKSVEDLTDKNVLIYLNKPTPFLLALDKELVLSRMNISFSNDKNVFNDILQLKVDAVITESKYIKERRSNNSLMGKKLASEVGLRDLYISKEQLPCAIVAVKKDLSTAIVENLTSLLKSSPYLVKYDSHNISELYSFKKRDLEKLEKSFIKKTDIEPHQNLEEDM